jgi:hypothetical protein
MTITGLEKSNLGSDLADRYETWISTLGEDSKEEVHRLKERVEQVEPNLTSPR